MRPTNNRAPGAALRWLACLLAAATAAGACHAAGVSVWVAKVDEAFVGLVPEPGRSLRFDIGAPPAPGARVVGCTLIVAPAPAAGDNPADHDVAVMRGPTKVGGWSDYRQGRPARYEVPLEPAACAPGTDVELRLVIESPRPRGAPPVRYHGASEPGSLVPRIVVEHDATARVSGSTTAWTYRWPEGFFDHALWGSKLLALTQPFSHDGALWRVAPSSDGSAELRRLTGQRRGWAIAAPAGQAMAAITSGSFAAVTPEGWLHIVTAGAILRCRLDAGIEARASLECRTAVAGRIGLDPQEAPAVAADGSLFFRNTADGGAFVAYNPSLQRLWRSPIVATAASPLSLGDDGRRLYALAEIALGTDQAWKLLSIDVASGQMGELDVATCQTRELPCPADKTIRPKLERMWPPAVTTLGSPAQPVDHVFIAANRDQGGLVQHILARAGEPMSVSATLDGRLGAAPVFAPDRPLLHLAWEDGRIERRGLDDASPPELLWPAARQRRATALLIDGGGTVYFIADFGAGARTLVSRGPGGNLVRHPSQAPRQLAFAADGSLIGFDDQTVRDLTPRSATAQVLSDYGAHVAYGAGELRLAAPRGAVAVPVAIKATSVSIARQFKWPTGKPLRIQIVPATGTGAPPR